jgi:hypothetical protein
VRCRDLFISSRACFAIEFEEKNGEQEQLRVTKAGKAESGASGVKVSRLTVQAFQSSHAKAEGRADPGRSPAAETTGARGERDCIIMGTLYQK